MNTGVKITAFTAAIAATFAAAYGVGAATGPLTTTPEPAAHAKHNRSVTPDRSAGRGGRADTTPAGLQTSQAGYTLDLKTPRFAAGDENTLRFAIRDQEGRQVTTYRREHGKELHLILASRDLVTYQHLHPTRAADGTWSAPVTLPAAGSYRVFADFIPATEGATNLTLGADLAVSGTYKAPALPEPAATTSVDGYTVTLDGDLRPGETAELTLTVNRHGRPVTDLQPYLGAYGHLVALRSGDLAYLHVHPNGEPGDGNTKPGPNISFTTTTPSVGTYRLFLDFQHNGTVRTAAFTVRTDRTARAPEAAADEHQDSHRH
ncbi:hypothetical protein ACIQPS_33425 [Streptomyces sp. NPDC091290]|uniref:hypothetical protein n=1 Tax=Streptomyces sp. NPDC091290 TaxID=3365990 RepID=UPI00380B50E5